MIMLIIKPYQTSEQGNFNTISPHSGRQHYWPVNFFLLLPAQKSHWQNVCKIAGNNVEPTSGYFVIFITQFPMFFFLNIDYAYMRRELAHFSPRIARSVTMERRSFARTLLWRNNHTQGTLLAVYQKFHQTSTGCIFILDYRYYFCNFSC